MSSSIPSLTPTSLFKKGLLTFSGLVILYDCNKEFGIQFNGTDQRLTFSWKSFVNRAENLLFFGPPLDGVRHYHERFKDITNIQYIRKIYYDLAREAVGDRVSSSALAIAYKSRVMDVLTGQLSEASIEVSLSIKEADVFSLDENKQSDQFLRVLDNICRCQFSHVIV